MQLAAFLASSLLPKILFKSLSLLSCSDEEDELVGALFYFFDFLLTPLSVFASKEWMFSSSLKILLLFNLDFKVF